MSEKLMLIVPAELVAKIDANRGDLSQAEFIIFLIDSLLNEKSEEKQVTSKDEINSIKKIKERNTLPKRNFKPLFKITGSFLKASSTFS
jgi:hypothetical protein